MVDTGTDDFPALVQKIKKGVKQVAIAGRVVGMRKVQSGGFLIKVRGDAAQVEVRAEVSSSAGPGVAVNAIIRRATLEVRDLDE